MEFKHNESCQSLVIAGKNDTLITPEVSKMVIVGKNNFQIEEIEGDHESILEKQSGQTVESIAKFIKR
jgi:UDP-N-acetylenolpyruvoylglucosamine reductase